ncbi:hypothetical protein SP19_131 [Salmonella phage 19]|nr:hypothetical protein SP19_131 [Salmonella phage 19]
MQSEKRTCGQPLLTSTKRGIPNGGTEFNWSLGWLFNGR